MSQRQNHLPAEDRSARRMGHDDEQRVVDEAVIRQQRHPAERPHDEVEQQRKHHQHCQPATRRPGRAGERVCAQTL